MLQGFRLQPSAWISPLQRKCCSSHSSENCTSAPLPQGTPGFSPDPGRKPKGKSSCHPFATPGQQLQQLPSPLPFLKRGTHTKNTGEREKTRRIIKSKAAELYDPAWGDSSTERCSCRSPSEHPIAQANDLAHRDTFFPRRQHPAKVAPCRDYPTRAGQRHRLQLSAAPGRGMRLPLAQGNRAAAALHSHGSFGGALTPRCGVCRR